MAETRPYIDFQEVKARVSIPDALEKLGVLDQFTRKGDVLTGVCPVPEHQHGPQPNDQQFKINKRGDDWLWKCFGDCNRGGDVIELVKAVQGLSDAHVRFWFAEHFGDRLTTTKGRTPRKVMAAKQDESTDAPPLKATASVELKPLSFYLNLNPDVPYLKRRGIEPATIERYGIGLSSKGVLTGYVATPVYRYPKQTADEYPVGYIGRWPGDDFDADAGRPRYKIPDGFEVSRVVYGLNEALESVRRENLPLIVVEGPFKVWHLVQRGFPDTVSTFTSSVSDEQAAILAATKRPIVLLFDGNEAGYEGMRKGAAKLITQTYVRVVKLSSDVEPDHLDRRQLDELLGFAKP